jgi:transposase
LKWRVDDAIHKLIDRLQSELAALRAENAALKAKVAELEARLAQNSQNSSKPPSSDPPALPRLPKKPTGRKPGGQPGHERHGRDLVPPERVDRFVEVRPDNCMRCGRRLSPGKVLTGRHQVVDVPKVKPFITEYQLFDGLCPDADCNTCTPAKLPPGVPTRGFGPRLTGAVGLLSGRFRLSKRLTVEILKALLDVDMSAGTVSNLEQEVSEALAAPVEEAREFVRAQPVVNGDETGWFQGRKGGRAGRAWLWVATSPLVTVFLIATSRGGVVARELLGSAFAGFFGSDRWSAYDWLPTTMRQLCWSHLRRDFQGFVDRGGEGARIGALLLKRTKHMFRLWHRIRDGPMTRADFRRRMQRLRAQIVGLLEEAAVCAEPKTRGMAAEMLKLRDALFTFVDHEDIEPTNNVAERRIRHAVMWRKTSFGTQCGEGSRFVERILTTTATLRQQDRNVLDYLADAYSARLSGQLAPSLLPP